MVYERERPPPKSSYRRTTARDDDEIDALTVHNDHQAAQWPRDGLRINHRYDLQKNTLEYITHLPGDTEDDARRM
eukprot:2949475-Amphidinium_carterae.1